MLIIRDLKMTFGGRVLFENASFQVNYGDRVALVGPNGAGKSTLFSIILKNREPDAGSPDHAKWLEKCERAHRRAEVLVEKHRHGATNKIDLYFDDRFTRFSNLVAEN